MGRLVATILACTVGVLGCASGEVASAEAGMDRPAADGAPTDAGIGPSDGAGPESAPMPPTPTPPTPTPPTPTPPTPPGADAAADDARPPSTTDTGPPCDAPCELVSQCGCAASERCDLADARGGRACVPDGTVGPGGECGPTAACRAGALCVGVRGDGSGLCHPFCEAAADCPSGSRCLPVVVSEGGTTTTIPGVRTCTSGCDLVPTAGCPAGYGCALFVEDPDAAFLDYYAECAAAGPGQSGDPCSASTGCSPGFQCLVRQCTRICRVAMGDSDCADDPGTSCRANFEAPYLVEGFEYGFCQ